MYCTKCGTQNDDNDFRCSNCGNELHAFEQQEDPPSACSSQPRAVQAIPNHMVLAILTTLFCCIPFGIASIVYAAQVNSKIAVGDINGAIEASNKAKAWGLWAFGLGLVFGIVYAAVQFVAATAGVR